MGSFQFSIVSFHGISERSVSYRLRVMSFTYSFEPILKTQPPLPIPYDDTPDYEGKLNATLY